MSGDGNRELGVEEIVERKDAEKLSLIIMRSVRGEADLFTLSRAGFSPSRMELINSWAGNFLLKRCFPS